MSDAREPYPAEPGRVSSVPIMGQATDWYRNWAFSLERFAAEKESKAAALLDDAVGNRTEAAAYRAYAETLCRHCNQPPESDGDHTCPCPFHDNDCNEHPA